MQQAMLRNVRDGACRVLEAAGALRPGYVSSHAAPSLPSNGSVISSARILAHDTCLDL